MAWMVHPGYCPGDPSIYFGERALPLLCFSGNQGDHLGPFCNQLQCGIGVWRNDVSGPCCFFRNRRLYLFSSYDEGLCSCRPRDTCRPPCGSTCGHGRGFFQCKGPGGLLFCYDHDCLFPACLYGGLQVAQPYLRR